MYVKLMQLLSFERACSTQSEAGLTRKSTKDPRRAEVRRIESDHIVNNDAHVQKAVLLPSGQHSTAILIAFHLGFSPCEFVHTLIFGQHHSTR